MHILPMINQKLHSPHTAAVLSARLAEIADRSGENVLVGTVKEKSFSVYKKPAEYVRNSFLPIAFGKFQDTEDGCNVDIKMRMHPLVSVLGLICSIGISVAWIVGIVMFITSGLGDAFLFLLIPILMLAFNAFLLFIGFHLPARKLLEILVRTFS